MAWDRTASDIGDYHQVYLAKDELQGIKCCFLFVFPYALKFYPHLFGAPTENICLFSASTAYSILKMLERNIKTKNSNHLWQL